MKFYTLQEAKQIGKKYIYKQKFNAWDRLCEERFADLYEGADLCVALNAMESIEKKVSFVYVDNMLKNDSYTSNSYNCAMEIVVRYSKVGPEFFKVISNNQLKPETLDVLTKISKQNEEYEKQEQEELNLNN